MKTLKSKKTEKCITPLSKEMMFKLRGGEDTYSESTAKKENDHSDPGGDDDPIIQ